ncbi:hypothetical protein [Azospirillum sp. ST 5-10]|uniref:hypothetical protein n=1 Tax=unclassified Azospirillum TaxID=2630922 RepID=UPI003F4A17EF
MIPPRALLAALAVSAAALWPPAAAAAESPGCPSFEPPTVTVDLRMAPLSHDFGRSVDQLAALPGRAPGPAGAGRGHVLGLTQVEFGERSEIAVGFQRLGDGSFCGALSTVDITFGAQERTVYVARELPRGSCIHDEVLTHEMRHVAVDEALVEEYRPIVKRRLDSVVGRVGTKRGRSQNQVMSALRRPVEAEMKKILRDFAREREKRQARIDTVDEYERVSQSCDGEVGTYLKGRARG